MGDGALGWAVVSTLRVGIALSVIATRLCEQVHLLLSDFNPVGRPHLAADEANQIRRLRQMGVMTGP